MEQKTDRPKKSQSISLPSPLGEGQGVRPEGELKVRLEDLGERLFFTTFPSPLGLLRLESDGSSLTALLFEGEQMCHPQGITLHEKPLLPLFVEAKAWLSRYFEGQDPGAPPPLRPQGTPFQQRVWQQLLTIPYGSTTTYGHIAKHLAAQGAMQRMSAQAVGQAVGRNPISIIIPCHRVIGANGTLTGYAGGLNRKVFLLNLEQKQEKLWK